MFINPFFSHSNCHEKRKTTLSNVQVFWIEKKRHQKQRRGELTSKLNKRTRKKPVLFSFFSLFGGIWPLSTRLSSNRIWIFGFREVSFCYHEMFVVVFSYIFPIAEEEKKCFLLIACSCRSDTASWSRTTCTFGSVTPLKNKRRRKTVRRRDLGALNEFNWP